MSWREAWPASTWRLTPMLTDRRRPPPSRHRREWRCAPRPTAPSLSGVRQQAFEFLRQALALALDPSDGADLALRAGEAATAAGRHQDGEQLLRQASDQFAAAGDQDGSDRALTGLATALINGSRFTDAIELLEPALADVDDFSARPGLIAAGGQLARALMLQYANFDRAVAAADRVLPAAERANMGSLVADLLVTKGTAMTMAGRGREGLALIQAGGSIAESQGATGVAVRSLINQSGQLGWSSPQEVLRGSQTRPRRGPPDRASGIHAHPPRQRRRDGGVPGRMGVGRIRARAASRRRARIRRSIVRRVHGAGVSRACAADHETELIEEIGRADVSEAAVRAQVDTVMGLDAAVDGRLEESLARYRSAQTEVAYATDFLWQLHVGTWLRDTRAIRIDPGPSTRRGLLRPGGGRHDGERRGRNRRSRGPHRRGADALPAGPGWEAGPGTSFEQALLAIDMVTVLDPTLPEVVGGRCAEPPDPDHTRGHAVPGAARSRRRAGTGGSASSNGSTTEPIPVVETEVAAS